MREDSLYRRRFNLEHEEWEVVAQAQGGNSSTYTWATAWSNYVRATFEPKRFHCFPGVGTDMDRVYIYVLEHKTLAGREDLHEDDAKARPLEVCFFTRIADAPPGELHVSRVDQSTSGMVTHTYGPAQILVAAGLHAPSPPGQTPAE